MVLLALFLVCAGLVTVVYSADEAIKHVMHLARYFRLSGFVVSFVIAGIVAVLPELSIGVIAALEGTSSLGFWRYTRCQCSGFNISHRRGGLVCWTAENGLHYAKTH